MCFFISLFYKMYDTFTHCNVLVSCVKVIKIISRFIILIRKVLAIMNTRFQYQHLRAIPKRWSKKELHIQLNRIKHNSELSTIAADPLFHLLECTHSGLQTKQEIINYIQSIPTHQLPSFVTHLSRLIQHIYYIEAADYCNRPLKGYMLVMKNQPAYISLHFADQIT